MINCIVDEGGLDYATYDMDGNRVGNFEDDENVPLAKYDTDKVLNSKAAKSSTNAKKAFYDDDNVKHSNELPSGGAYNCIPDFGLAMITMDYINKYSPERKYSCDIASATGIISYLGYLKNESYIDTYNDIFDRCYTREEWGINAGTNSSEELKEYLQQYIPNVDVVGEWNPSFETIKREIYQFYREPVPIRLVADEHSVLGVSYYEAGGSKYVGIWRNWNYDKSDPNHVNQSDISGIHDSNSGKNVLYFNYEDRANWNSKDIWCGFVRNAKSNNIKELHTENVDANKMTVKCYVPYGTTSVSFPTWTEANGQDDIKWYSGKVSGGTGIGTIDFANHNNSSGKYITHIYAYDKNKELLACASINYYVHKRDSITNVCLNNNTSGKIVCSCYAPIGTEYVTYEIMAISLGRNGHKMLKKSVTSNSGFVSRNINKKDFNDAKGHYLIKIVAYNSRGEVIGDFVQESAVMK